MPYNLVLNSSNVIGSSNSTFRYRFINGSFNINEDSEVCVSQIVIPYSWFNINNAYYKNATIQYNFPNGSSSNTYTCVFPNGFYSVNDLSNYLQLYMQSQNQYFYNSTSAQNQYYIQIITNSTYYSNQLILSNVPTTLPTNYSTPSQVINGYTYTGFNCNPTTAGSTGGSANYYPTSTLTPQIIIPSYTGIYGIGSILGFISGTYPSITQSTSYNILSNTTPNATPVNSIIVRSDIVNNQCAMPSDILDTFYPNVGFGSNITYTPSYEKWISIQSGVYDSLTVYLQDQNFNTLQANDPNILISLLLRQGKEKEKTIPLEEPKQIISLVKHIPFKDEKIDLSEKD